MLQTFVDPSWWGRIKTAATGTDKENAAIRAIQDVDDALKANGVSESQRKQVYNNARSKIRSDAYGRFWSAVDKQDWEKADRWAKALLNLGVAGKEIRTGGKRRGLTATERAPITTRFKRAGERSRSPVLDYNKAIKFDLGD